MTTSKFKQDYNKPTTFQPHEEKQLNTRLFSCFFYVGADLPSDRRRRYKIGNLRAVPSLVLQRLQDASWAFNSFQPHDDIGALERPQIPENDKGTSHQRQILLPSRGLVWSEKIFLKKQDVTKETKSTLETNTVKYQKVTKNDSSKFEEQIKSQPIKLIEHCRIVEQYSLLSSLIIFRTLKITK